MTDAFDTPEPPVERDSYGRYLLPHPVTGKRQAWTRVTTFTRTLTDEYGLNLWKERMVVKGLSQRPDLLAVASSLDVKADSKQLNRIADQAKEAAGASASANLGTAIHSFTESVDQGGSLDGVPKAHRDDVTAYLNALANPGVTIPSGMVERITCVPEFNVAGTLDRIYSLNGQLYLGDVKTGQDLSYNWMEISIQLAMYQVGVSQFGVYDRSSKTWSDPIQGVSDRVGIVAHVPSGSSQCTLYWVNLDAGRRFAELSSSVRAARASKNIAAQITLDSVRDGESVFSSMDPKVGASGRNWELEFSSVASKAAALALYREAQSDKLVGSVRLRQLVELGRAALTKRS